MTHQALTFRAFPALLAAAALAAACGGGSSSSPLSGPTLVGTAIPTAVPTAAPPLVCVPPVHQALPASIPADARALIPPDFVVWNVTASPNLVVEGRWYPPNPGQKAEPPFGIAANAIGTAAKDAGWTAQVNVTVSDTDYTATAPDGRELHFYTYERPDCEGQVDVVFDFKWLKG